MKIAYKLLTSTAIVPQKMTEHSSGWDLSADLKEAELLEPGERAAIPTGIAVEIPPGFEAQIRPRSGLALNLGLGVLNAPGTIDADYRGEIKVILFNASQKPLLVQPGMRIAQMVFCALPQVQMEEVETLGASVRAEGGFGHTGH